MNILIVEDEEKLRKELKLFLENSGYTVSILDDFNNTVEDIIKSHADIILLDINIPNLNGEIVCKKIRKQINTPVIMLTSKNTVMDELISFNYGADDFITKPFNTQILLARIERLLKIKTEVITYKDITLDLSTSIIYNDQKKIDLTKNELKIMCYLFKNAGKIVSRDDLINYLWDSDDFVDDNTLTVNINRLRIKLEELGYKELIRTKRGQGYIII